MAAGMTPLPDALDRAVSARRSPTTRSNGAHPPFTLVVRGRAGPLHGHGDDGGRRRVPDRRHAISGSIQIFTATSHAVLRRRAPAGRRAGKYVPDTKHAPLRAGCATSPGCSANRMVTSGRPAGPDCRLSCPA
jgi:hypothetical protein